MPLNTFLAHFKKTSIRRPLLTIFLNCLARVITREREVSMLILIFSNKERTGSFCLSPFPVRPFEAASEAASAST